MKPSSRTPVTKRRALRVARSGLMAVLRRIDRSLSRGGGSPEAPYVKNLAEAYERGFAGCPCVFVLSTGRVGTTTLTRLFELSPMVTATHEAHPRLVNASFEAYLNAADEAPSEDWCRVVLAARDDAVCTANRMGRIYIETSHRMTFLAGILARVFPASRFIHLHRHPYPVVRSAMCRGHYEHHPWDFARIRPRPDEPLAERWAEMPTFEKACWHWTRINQHGLDFRSRVGAERFFDLPADRLFDDDPTTVKALFEFAGATPPAASEVRRVLAAKINAQRSDAFPEVEDWTDDQRETVWRWAGEAARALGYRDDRW